MQHSKNILILTSRTGGGHVSLAEALQDLLIEDTRGRGEGDVQTLPTLAITAITFLSSALSLCISPCIVAVGCGISVF